MTKPARVQYLELADRARLAADKQAAQRRASAPAVTPLSRFPPHDFGTIVSCPNSRCRGATEDGMLVRDPFRGRACFWCGACWDSDGHGGLIRMERTVVASMPPRALPDGVSGSAARGP